MSEILVQDVTAVDALRSLAKKFDPQKLAYIMSTTIGGLISAGSGGIWVCPEYKNLLQICRGSIEGNAYDVLVNVCSIMGFSNIPHNTPLCFAEHLFPLHMESYLFNFSLKK